MRSLNSELGRNSPHSFREVLSELLDEIDLKHTADGSDGVVGIRTGFRDLDVLTSGLRPGSLAVIAARPAMGKTALAFGFAANVVLEQKLSAVIFSMDMSSAQVAARIICQIGLISCSRVNTGGLEPDDLKKLNIAIERLKGTGLYIDDTCALKADQIRERAMEIYKQIGRIGLIVVDDLQLMHSKIVGKHPVAASKDVMSSLRQLAHEANVPVVILSQLNRRLEHRKDKRPRLGDLPNRGILQNVDLLMFIYRDEYYRPDTRDKGTAEIIVGRNRHGRTGIVKLNFDSEFGSFESLLPKLRANTDGSNEACPEWASTMRLILSEAGSTPSTD